MAFIGNLLRFFIIFVGGLGCCGCCGSGGCVGHSFVLGRSSLFLEMYCVLSVLVCVWLRHGMWQFCLHDGVQNSCVAIFNALISNLVGDL